MGISPNTVRWLREQGHDALHLHEQGLAQLDDRAVLAKAQDEERVLLAHDLDFGDLLAASGAALPSVVIFRLADMRAGSVNRYLGMTLREAEADLQDGAIVAVREDRIRVRSLPIHS